MMDEIIKMDEVNMRLLNATYYKLKMMLSDRLFTIAMLILPLMVAVVSGYALKNEKYEAVRVAIVDEDGTSDSELLLERLAHKEGISVQRAERSDAVELLERGKVEEVFFIKDGFSEKLARGENRDLVEFIRSPDAFSADFAAEVVAGEIYRLYAGRVAVRWVEESYAKRGLPMNDGFSGEVAEYYAGQWEPAPLMTVQYEVAGSIPASNTEKTDFEMPTASTGVLLFFIMFYVLFNSGWLVQERANGTLKRLATGSGVFIRSFLASFLSLMGTGLIQIIMFLVVNRVILEAPLFMGGGSYGVLLAYLFAVSSISLFLSAVFKTSAQLQAGAPVLALLTGIVGGCFFSLSELSGRLKKLSLFTPQGWALRGMQHSDNLSLLLQPVMILSITALILLSLSYMIISRHVRNQR